MPTTKQHSVAAANAPWKRFQGAKRIQAELQSMQRAIDNGSLAQVSSLTVVDDDLFRWRFRVKDFDEDVAAGKQLNADLRQLALQHGQDHLLMEARFPQDYPASPFFLRVVSPRCVMYSGHVTAGGSICIEALVNTGGPHGWQSDICVESILALVLANMLDCEVVEVRTATGPGGLSGPLRVDLRLGRAALREYSAGEAEQAYARVVANHGWRSAPRPAGGVGGSSRPQKVPAPTAGARAGPSSAPGLPVPAAATTTAAAAAAGGWVAVPKPGPSPKARGGRHGRAGWVPVGAASGNTAPLALPPAATAAAAPGVGSSRKAAGAGSNTDVVDLSMEHGAGDANGNIGRAAADAAAGPSGSRSGAPPGGTAASDRAAALGVALQQLVARGADPSAVHEMLASGADVQAILDAAMAPRKRKGSTLDPLDLTADDGAGPSAAAAAAAAGPSRRRDSKRPAGRMNDRSDGGNGADPDVLVIDDAQDGGVSAKGGSTRHKRGSTRPGPASDPDVMVIDGDDDTDPRVTRGKGAPGAQRTVPGASRGVDGDAALARLVSELEVSKAAAERERRERQRLQGQVAQLAAKALMAAKVPPPAAHAAGRALLAAPPPEHWEPMTHGFGVKFVVLPLPGDAAAGTTSVDSGGGAGPPADDGEGVAVLMGNGLDRSDAVQLLQHCNNNADDALELAMQALECDGGIMALLRRQRSKAAASSSGAGAAVDRGAKMREEVDMVLGRFERASGLSRSRVVRVERVQNWQLWNKYVMRRSEVEALSRGQAHAAGEEHMWHGTSAQTIAVICSQGFDTRVSNRAGALGEGVYFAVNASYSIKYVNRNAAIASGSQPQPHAFVGSTGAMLLCRVALGRLASGAAGLRRPPAGADTVYMNGTVASPAPGSAGDIQLGNSAIVAVFDNVQAYPEYMVHIS